MSNVKVISIILTHSCNLDCVYCYEKHKSNIRVTLSTAQEIIREEFEAVAQSSNYDSLRIEFFGGEPFLEFDLMRSIVEWVESERWPVSYHFFATTNGTVLTKTMMDWLKTKRRLLTVGLSFDGTPEMQDINRSNSSRLIDLAFFQENYPDQTIKMTVSPLTLGSFARGVIYLQEMGFCVDPSCACGEDWNDECCEEYQNQLYELAQYYLLHPEVEPIDLLILPFDDVLKGYASRPHCGAGRGFVTYDVTGESYPCHMFTPLVVGNGSTDTVSAELFQEESKVDDSCCAACLVVNLCTTCYGYNYGRVGNINHRDVRLCELFQRRCKVAAWFNVQRFEIKKSEGKQFSPDEIENMEGIICFYNNLEKLGFFQV